MLGDSFGAGIVDHLSKADLASIDRMHELEMGDTPDAEEDVVSDSKPTKAEEAGMNNDGFVNGEVGSRL